MDNFFKAMKDSDWSESVTDMNFDTHQQEMLDDCEKVVRNEPELEYDMVVRKSYAEYVKEINRMRSQLRYMKKSVGYGEVRVFTKTKEILLKHKEGS